MCKRFVCVCVCVCVCVSVRACARVCVCVCVWERARARARALLTVYILFERLWVMISESMSPTKKIGFCIGVRKRVSCVTISEIVHDRLSGLSRPLWNEIFGIVFHVLMAHVTCQVSESLGRRRGVGGGDSFLFRPDVTLRAKWRDVKNPRTN